MNPEQEKARQSAEAEMKIYTPHRVIQEKCDNVAFDNAPVRIYERPYHPNRWDNPPAAKPACCRIFSPTFYVPLKRRP